MYIANDYYKPFEYTLPTSFINAGNPQLVSYSGWSDDRGVKAVQFTFSNGQEVINSPIFGNLTATTVTKSTKALSDPVKSMHLKMLNTTAYGQQIFGVVNFQPNGLLENQVGPDNTAAPSAVQ